ncbi:hypothetical protein DIPPA_12905 [Diplonema papillatum]|nr:hypothetical protein DIPPA_12905 [Diplonema papillatum]
MTVVELPAPRTQSGCRRLYAILVVALATFIIVVDVVDCHGVRCRQQWGGGERLLRRYTRRLSTMYDGCEGKGAASEPRPRRLDDPVYRQLLAETEAGELPRGAPADDDPTHVPWEELEPYGYRQDEAFRAAFAARGRNESYARFAAVRRENLAKLREREAEAPLAGLEPRTAVRDTMPVFGIFVLPLTRPPFFFRACGAGIAD